MADSANRTDIKNNHEHKVQRERKEQKPHGQRREKQGAVEPGEGKAERTPDQPPNFSHAWRQDRSEEARRNGMLGVAAYKSIGSVTPR